MFACKAFAFCRCPHVVTISNDISNKIWVDSQLIRFCGFHIQEFHLKMHLLQLLCVGGAKQMYSFTKCFSFFVVKQKPIFKRWKWKEFKLLTSGKEWQYYSIIRKSHNILLDARYCVCQLILCVQCGCHTHDITLYKQQVSREHQSCCWMYFEWMHALFGLFKWLRIEK